MNWCLRPIDKSSEIPEKNDGQTFVEFGREKEILFDRWCTSKKVETYDQLRQLVLVEEFKRCVPSDIRTHLDEQHVNDLELASKTADDYALTHKSSFHKSSTHSGSYKKRSNYVGDVAQSDNSETEQSKVGSNKDGDDPKRPSTGGSSYKSCAYCKKRGHLKADCWFLQKKNAQVKPTALTAVMSENKGVLLHKDLTDDHMYNVGKNCPNDDIRERFKPFLSEGLVSQNEDGTNVKKIEILRDTGASQYILLEEALPVVEDSSLGTSVLLHGLEEGFVNAPLHKVYLKCDLFTGFVVVASRPNLPVKGVSLLLGNDIAGGKVTADPKMSEEPKVQEDTQSLEDQYPSLFPACVVTRGMKNKCKDDEIDLEDTFMGHIEVTSKKLETSEENQGRQFENSGDLKQAFNKEQLIHEQKMDPEISLIMEEALSESETGIMPVCFFIKSGVLMRKWRPIDVPADEEWNVFHQIVVPSIYRREILSVAHEGSMAGHLGVRKTCDRILRHFYWPKLRKDVSQFCKTCHICQVVGKPNQKVPKAPLHPIPAFDEPFSRVLVDCVGPLPKTKTGNEYILTIMCASTRFPEAIPLRNIKAKAIVKALVKFFTLFGIPESIQSDQGSNFMSGIFRQVMQELGVKQHRSSAYHPESQGALERFHQTIKTMLRAYCLENDRNWDEGLPLVLFAVREVVQESLGFSPFELVFGHTVHGPLKVMKEQWLADESESNLLSYVSEFKGRLTNAWEMARANLKDAQVDMKNWYDEKARERKFKPGDKVLVLLPITGHPLQAKYHGPYIISHKVNDVNYVVNTPDRRKSKQLCHVNMLKEYHDR